MTDLERFEQLLLMFTRNIRNAFRIAISGIVDSAILKDVIAALEAGDPEAAFRALGFSPAAMRPLTQALERSYETGGEYWGSTFPKILQTPIGRAVFRFDVRNVRAETYLRENSSRLITAISEDTRVNVKAALEAGMNAGRNPRDVALDIVGRVDPATGKRAGGLVGVTANQEIWIRNARAQLETLDARYFERKLRDKRFDGVVKKAIKSGKPLDRPTVDRLITSMRNKTLKYRGDVIGRTEALGALNNSEMEAARQAIDMGAAREQDVEKEWDDVGDLHTRFTHRALNKQVQPLNEPFISPSGARMMHPHDTSLGAPASEIAQCRCRWKLKIDWLARVAT